MTTHLSTQIANTKDATPRIAQGPLAPSAAKPARATRKTAPKKPDTTFIFTSGPGCPPLPDGWEGFELDVPAKIVESMKRIAERRGCDLGEVVLQALRFAMDRTIEQYEGALDQVAAQ